MKTIVHIPKMLAAAFALLICFAFSNKYDDKTNQNLTDTSACLEISGKLAKDLRDKQTYYKVKLYNYNRVIDSLNIRSDKSFKFMLRKNSVYAIKVEKPGYIARLVSIQTSVPINSSKKIFSKFQFNMDLYEETYAQYFNNLEADFPAALISYDKRKKVFHYDKKYTGKPSKKIITKK